MSVCAMINGVTRPQRRYSTPQKGGRPDCLSWGPAQLIKPTQQVPDHKDFFQDPVVRSAEQQHRDSPPHSGQRLRYDVQAHPEVERSYIEAKPGSANYGRDKHASESVPPGLAGIQADHRWRLS